MANVKQVQVTANLFFDDGFVITVSSPVWMKDIRHGDIFSDEQIEDILQQSGEGLAKLINEKTSNGLHKQAKLIESEQNMPGPKPSTN